MSPKLELFAAVLLVGLEPAAEAHDIYLHLKDRLGNRCSDETDCRPAPYRVTPTGVQMFVDGEWIPVPDYTIQYRTLPDDPGETDGGTGAGLSATGMATG